MHEAPCELSAHRSIGITSESNANCSGERKGDGGGRGSDAGRGTLQEQGEKWLPKIGMGPGGGEGEGGWTRASRGQERVRGFDEG